MYYPILRGRQNELIALRELLNKSLLSEKIIPIIEPVRLSPTLISTLEAFDQSNNSIAVVRNPKVGSYFSDLNNDKNAKYIDKVNEIMSSNIIKRSLYVGDDNEVYLDEFEKQGLSRSDVIAICKNADNIDWYTDLFNGSMVIVPYASAFRRIRENRIILEDKFKKKEKNADYKECDDEFFSNDHLYFEMDGYLGFSDYSIIGEEYSESGFAPRAVAIHIVYFDEEKNLRIKHFVSDDNEDIKDPAGKFYQAVIQLVEWNKKMGLDTEGIKEFERICKEQSYPGLGVVKKLSIMHHMELIGRQLDGNL